MKAVLVGTGSIGKEHLEAIASIEGVVASAVCDLSAASAEATADRFAIPQWYQDYDAMLQEIRPDIVHITTPAPTHYQLAKTALKIGAGVIVEKPITTSLEELYELQALSEQSSKLLIEDHNYRWNRPVQEILRRSQLGELGSIVHVEVAVDLDILGEGSPFADATMPHPSIQSRGGAASDFMTHLSYLCHCFIGDHVEARTVWLDHPELPQRGFFDFRGVVKGNSATANLSFSCRSQPDAFTVRVHGTKGRVETNLFETGLFETFLLDGPRPLMPFRNGIRRAKREAGTAFKTITRKLSGGPGALEGLHELINQTYRSLSEESPPPVTPAEIWSVNQLVHDLLEGAPRK